YLVDLFINGVVTPIQVYLKANILEPIRPQLILPEVVDESKWWEGKHHYADPEGKYIFVFQGNVHGGENAYNTKLVNPKEFKSYWDFLDPKWKGKIVAYDVSRVSTVAHALRFLYNHPDLGADFVRRFFGEMEITYSRDERQMIDWLGAGKFHLAFFVTDIEDGAKQELPVKFFEPGQFKEGAFVGPSQGGVSFFKNAPHPNAARVAINWLLSREGQEAYQKMFAQQHDVRQSMREDISMDAIPLTYRRVKGVKYIYSGRPEWLDMGPVTRVIKEAQQAAKKSGERMQARLWIGVLILSILWTADARGAQADAWKADWEKSVEAAKKEGQLTLYGSPDFEKLFGEFQKKYPEVKVTGVFNRGADVAKRLMAERRAGQFNADLYVNGMTTGYNVFYKAKALDPIPPLLVLPEVTDSSKWWRGRLPFIDAENQYLFSINGENRIVLAFNTKLVNPAEIKSYWDLLNPKWKGKIVAYDPTLGGSGDSMRFFYHNKSLGPEFIKRILTEMDIVISTDTRQMGDWLAGGKFALSIFAPVSRM